MLKKLEKFADRMLRISISELFFCFFSIQIMIRAIFGYTITATDVFMLVSWSTIYNVGEVRK